MTFKLRCVFIIAPLILLLDQWSKWSVRAEIPFGGVIPIWPGYFDLVHVQNTGAAFGMLAGAAAAWREPFFYLVSAVALTAIVVMLGRLRATERLTIFILSLLFGGVIGNLIDRVLFGSVTDFVSVHWRDAVWSGTLFGWHWQLPLDWPAFNVADSAITVSMVLLAWQLLRGEGRTV